MTPPRPTNTTLSETKELGNHRQGITKFNWDFGADSSALNRTPQRQNCILLNHHNQQTQHSGHQIFIPYLANIALPCLRLSVYPGPGFQSPHLCTPPFTHSAIAAGLVPFSHPTGAGACLLHSCSIWSCRSALFPCTFPSALTRHSHTHTTNTLSIIPNVNPRGQHTFLNIVSGSSNLYSEGSPLNCIHWLVWASEAPSKDLDLATPVIKSRCPPAALAHPIKSILQNPTSQERTSPSFSSDLDAFISAVGNLQVTALALPYQASGRFRCHQACSFKQVLDSTRPTI